VATIRKEVTLDAPLIDTWAAFADYHAVDKRIATGFVVKCEPKRAAAPSPSPTGSWPTSS